MGVFMQIRDFNLKLEPFNAWIEQHYLNSVLLLQDDGLFENTLAEFYVFNGVWVVRYLADWWVSWRAEMLDLVDNILLSLNGRFVGGGV